MIFSSTELHLFAAVSAGGLCVCCPTIQDSDLVKIWEASPSEPLAVTTRVSLPLERHVRSALTQVAAALLGFPMGEMTPFLVLGHSLAEVSFFSPPSLLERRFFPTPDSWQDCGHGGLVAHCRIKLFVP